MDFAIAPCCWGVYWPTGNHLSWDDYLEKIAAAGYRSTELGPFGFGPTGATEMTAALARYDIGLVAAAHVHTLADISTWDILKEKTHAICALLAEFGQPQFILMDESEFYPKDQMGVVDGTQWEAVIKQTSDAAAIARSYGLSFAFHPHVGTCVETEDQIERLLAETDPDVVGLCLDTGHHAYWNADPLAFLRKHRSRVTSVHLKNVNARVRNQVHAEGIHCDEAFEIGVMTDLNTGAVDIAAIVADLERHGFEGPVVVEQDLSETNPRTPEVIAQHNLAFLKSVDEKATF
jgi:inosose dehydratase